MKDWKERFKSINKEMMWVADEEVDDVIHFIEQIISERDKEWRMALEDNRGETMWGQASENSIMEISLHNFTNAVLKQITNPK